eukprot:g1961.t1
MAPLLPKKTLPNNGSYLVNASSWQALLGGILLGLAFGTALSMFFFSTPAPVYRDAPSINQLAQRVETENWQENHESKISGQENKDENKVIEDFIKQELAPARKTSARKAPEKTVPKKTAPEKTAPVLQLHEGTRHITDYELKGGWRLTPEVLQVSERHPKAKVISESKPKVIMFHGFLSKEEIDHMSELASTHMSRSKVVSGKDGREKDARTSYGAWLNGKYRDDVVAHIEERIHDAIGIPMPFGEGIYVLRYEKGQKYEPHTDNCARQGEVPRDACLNFLKRAGGPLCGEGHGGASCGDRIATFIMYLKSPIKGGDTVFPRSRISEDQVKKSGRADRASGFSDYCSSPLYFKILPKPGDAVLFWDYIPKPDILNHDTFSRGGSYEWTNQTTEAINDNSSLHGGCPVLEGEKWIATKWIRSSYFA